MRGRIPRDDQLRISFVTCLSCREVYVANLVASRCLGISRVHDVIAFPDGASAAAGLNGGFAHARHDWLVCVHQDVYLPAGWDLRLAEQRREAEDRFGPIGVAGVYGVGDVITPHDLTQPLGSQRIGSVIDRGRELRDGPKLPAPVATLHELLLVIRRDSGLRFDPALGLHLYGADICLHGASQCQPLFFVCDRLCRPGAFGVFTIRP